MVTHMKTTVEISDSLLDAARRAAARDGLTLRELIERALHREVAGAAQLRAFRLRDASVKGQGLQPGLQSATWDRLRELAYEGRGG